jgi:hypothetical protein
VDGRIKELHVSVRIVDERIKELHESVRIVDGRIKELHVSVRICGWKNEKAACVSEDMWMEELKCSMCQ